MITHLRIRDFAIIEELDTDFSAGLNVMTGETGSGKSIIIQAISLALGGRASSSFVSTGKNKAFVEMTVDQLSERVMAELREAGIDISDGELIISREISTTGKNVCRLNGSMVTLGVLTGIGRSLADIHGQYEHQSLLNPDNHLALIDSYGGEALARLKEAAAKEFRGFHQVDSQLKKLLSDREQSMRQRDFMKFEYNEIQSAEPVEGEDDELKARLAILQNSEKIFTSLNKAYDIMYSCGLDKAAAALESIGDFSNRFGEIRDVVRDCAYAVEAACEDARRARDSVTFSPEEVNDIVERLNVLDSLKKKYGGTLEQVIAYGEELGARLAVIENSEEYERQLRAQRTELEAKLAEVSGKLSQARKNAAEGLASAITGELAELNFKNAKLDVRFSENCHEDGTPAWSAEGVDSAEFWFSANLGEALKPLADVASGGEASRIMLAFKRRAGDTDKIPTMIFDEIDTGISGITASVVAGKLRQIAEGHQVICITHLPQIAAAGQAHYVIEKEIREGRTYTNVARLPQSQRVREIARLTGGTNITETTLTSASELLASFDR